MRKATTLLLILVPLFIQAQTAPVVSYPPNSPAQIEFVAATGNVTIGYAGNNIFSGHLSVRSGSRAHDNPSDVIFSVAEARGSHDALGQKIRFRLPRTQPEGEIEITGIIEGSNEAFAAETFSQSQLDFPLIRTSSGPDHNLRNNAVYDRHLDWVLIGPSDGETMIVPKETGSAHSAFQITIRGRSLLLVFEPRFYQKHRNISSFEPWTYRVWPQSVAGWSSWWAYEDQISEDLIRQVTDVFSQKLRNFGYQYIQLDAGYHVQDGYPKQTTKTNSKFPTGLKGLAAYIRSQGLVPAIWENVAIDDDVLVRDHPEWFYRGSDGKPFKAPWVGYGIDGSNPEAVNALIRPTYRDLHSMGYGYIKIDALRHLLYDSSYRVREYLAGKGTSPGQALRNIMQAVREEVGTNTYVLACWGVLPELAGVADGSRLGTDGFGPHTLAQYNSWNNVVWRNDPDHLDIAGEGEDTIRPVLTSMAGAQLLVSDPVEVYGNDSKIEGMRRSAPVLFTMPGQLYDYDPTATNNLLIDLRNANGGADPGPIDAEQLGNIPQWWLMDISRSFENWSVLARLNWHDLPSATVRFRELGLAADKQYVVYEFWSHKAIGVFKESFPAAAQRAKEVRIYAIRELRPIPQIISTSRHITQGGVDLRDVQWSATEKRLSGESDVVAGDVYRITIRVPMGFVLSNAMSDEGRMGVSSTEGFADLSVMPARSGSMKWSVQFR